LGQPGVQNYNQQTTDYYPQNTDQYTTTGQAQGWDQSAGGVQHQSYPVQQPVPGTTPTPGSGYGSTTQPPPPYVLQEKKKGNTKLIIGVVAIIAIIIIAIVAIQFFIPSMGGGEDEDILDTDGDKIPDIEDTDMDNDGKINQFDKFPLNSTEWEDVDNDFIGDNSDPVVVKQLTSASEETTDTNMHPRLSSGKIFFIRYSWNLFSDPPEITSQDIYKYTISSGSYDSVYHDVDKVSTGFSDWELMLINEIAVSSSAKYFTQDSVEKEGGITYVSTSSELYKVVGNGETLLMNSDAFEECMNLEIYGSKVVFQRVTQDSDTVYLYDGSTVQLISEDLSYHPDIYESSIVYVKETGGENYIELNKAGATQQIAATATGVEYFSPRIYEDSIVYIKKDGSDSDIYFYDGADKSDSKLTDGSGITDLFDFDGKYVLFKRSSGDSSKNGLFIMNVNNQDETKISNFGGNADLEGSYVTFYYDENIYLARLRL
jgi:hypothetical protein